MTFQSLAAFVLAGEPDRVSLQHTLYQLAEGNPKPEIRRGGLRRLSENPHLDTELIKLIATDRDPKVRGDFWEASAAVSKDGKSRFGENAFGDIALAAELIGQERLSSVRAKAVAGGGLGPEVMRAACTPLRTQLAKAVLQVTGPVPAELAHEALRMVWRAKVTPTLDQRKQSMQAAMKDRQIAEKVLGDELLPPQLWFAAALCEEFDEDEALAALESALSWLDGQEDPAEGWHGVDEKNRRWAENQFTKLADRITGISEATMSTMARASVEFLHTRELTYQVKYEAVRDGQVDPKVVFQTSSHRLLQLIELLPPSVFADDDQVAALLIGRNSEIDVLDALAARGVAVDEDSLIRLIGKATRLLPGVHGRPVPGWVQSRPKMAACWINAMPVHRVGDAVDQVGWYYPEQIQAEVFEELAALHRNGAMSPATRERVFSAALSRMKLSREQMAQLPAESVLRYVKETKSFHAKKKVLDLVSDALTLVHSNDAKVTRMRAEMFDAMVDTGSTLEEIMLAVTAVVPDDEAPDADPAEQREKTPEDGAEDEVPEEAPAGGVPPTAMLF